MTLAQLHALCAIVDRGLSVSRAAETLHRSQPAVTRQLQQLETGLGLTLFVRQRNRILKLTPEGEAIARVARKVLADTRDLARMAESLRQSERGELTLATTHTQARYTLPRIIGAYMERYPDVALSLRQGTPAQCAAMVATGQADLAICTETSDTPGEVVQIPCYRLQRCVVTPADHPLLRARRLTLKGIARYPVITYAEGFSGRAIVDRAFSDAGLAPKVVLSAIDADVSKSYVELGLGIAILASVAFDPDRDHGLRQIRAGHLFAPSRLSVVVRRGAYLPAYTLAFIRLFSPALPEAEIRSVLAGAAVTPRTLHDL
ncbi:MAG: LysR substrate-binding domain-containing protein [Pseudomonadota bacterium]|nr:LysR substrate-binding domain-containing protein [Pseudomonadota bacterium]